MKTVSYGAVTVGGFKVKYGVREDESIWVSFARDNGYHEQFDWNGSERLLKTFLLGADPKEIQRLWEAK